MCVNVYVSAFCVCICSYMSLSSGFHVYSLDCVCVCVCVLLGLPLLFLLCVFLFLWLYDNFPYQHLLLYVPHCVFVCLSVCCCRKQMAPWLQNPSFSKEVLRDKIKEVFHSSCGFLSASIRSLAFCLYGCIQCHLACLLI